MTTPLTSLSAAKQLAGQRIIYSYSGLTPPASLFSVIRAGEAAGVIFFADNIAGSAQLGRVIAQLRQADAQSPLRAPLLLMTDQEGGRVRRLPGAPTLSEKQVGQSADPRAQASRAGSTGGANLARTGIDVDLAPVVDVYRQPGDFDDRYQRSYSADPAAVGALGGSFIKALQGRGVAATAKHFPGLGSATADQDTDNATVTLPVPLAQLRGTDEAPYQAAIAAGVKLIMVSWAVYPALDPAHPAGMSPAVVRQELRGRLGFTGVTVTDALEASALNAYGTTGQRATAAVDAGMDLLLCSSGKVGQGEDAMTGLADGLVNGQLDQAQFTQAADRVTALRRSLS